MFKKILASIMVSMLALSTSGAIYADDQSPDNEDRIQQIYEERAQLMAEGKPGYEEKYEELGEELQSLGVEFLTTQEVQEKNKIAMKSLTGPVPYIGIPTSTNIVWSSYRNNFVKNGVTYEVQHLAAEPNSKSSNIKETGGLLVSSSSSWQAGVQGLAKTVAFEGASKISAGVDIFLTVFDAVDDFISDSNFGMTTEVTDIKANYTWTYIENVDFMYVKKAGESDDNQSLAYVSTAVSGTYSWQIPTFSYKSNGAIKTTSITGGSRNFNNPSSGHRNGANAVNAYVNPTLPRSSYVTQVKLTGVESKTVKTIYPLQPAYPGAVY